MHDQPRLEPYEESRFFADRRGDRVEPEGTIARGDLEIEDAVRTGRRDGELLSENPIPIDRTVLLRGRERFDIYCSPCHDHVGTGNGLVVQRGFPAPPSLHAPRLREAPDGYVFDVITRGFGTMYSYSASVRPRDRWAIVAYVRALQLSQNAKLDDVPPAERAALMETRP